MLYLVTCRDTHPEAETWNRYLAEADAPAAAARKVAEATVYLSPGDTYRLTVTPLPTVGPDGLANLAGLPADWFEYALDEDAPAEDAESGDHGTLRPIPEPDPED